MKIADLDKNQLWALRQEICLNSLFLKDYENSFGIDAKEVYNFFDGYVEYLSELCDENAENYNVVVIDALDFDSPDNLYAWFMCVNG